MKQVHGELFHMDAAVSESLEAARKGFRDFLMDKKGGSLNGVTPEEFADSRSGGMLLDGLFAATRRSLKCEECGHLIELGRLP